MADRRSGAVLKQLETLFRLGTLGALTDGQLLERFATQHGMAAEAAFEVLVERHGPMVWRICSGVLDDPHDAEDASQATFLVLVRRAGSIRHRDSVASWLFGVAGRVAARARVDAARRRKHERRGATMTTSSTSVEGSDDLGPVLHEEVRRLPEKYRAPVVICYLEGRTCEEASRRLGCPVGTIKVRLSRARDRLRARLSRRGLALPAGLVVAGLASQATPAAMPPALVRATVRTALAHAAGRAQAGAVSASVVGLSEGSLGVICGTKLKMAALLLLGTIPARPGHPIVAGEPPGPGGPAVEIAPKAGSTILEVPGRTAYDPDSLVKIRLRYEAEVRGSRVSVGLRIKKGDPL